MQGTAMTQELRHGRELPERPSSRRAGWEGASPVDPGLHAHRPAPCDKGLLLGYPPADRIVGRTRWQTPAPKGADGPPSARTGLRLNGRLPGGTRPLGSRATAAHTPTGRTLAWRRQSKSLASLWLSLSISSGEKVFPRSLKGIKRREAGVRTDPRVLAKGSCHFLKPRLDGRPLRPRCSSPGKDACAGFARRQPGWLVNHCARGNEAR